MPLLYAEGEENAFARLQEEIRKSLKSSAGQIDRAPVSNQAGIQYIYGGARFGSHPLPPPATTPNYDFGIRLGHAPQIDEDKFIGRDDELEQLRTWLTPQPRRRNVVSLSGLGGVGKPQLSMRLIQRSGSEYSSVWWLNAKDETTLKAGLAALGQR